MELIKATYRALLDWLNSPSKTTLLFAQMNAQTSQVTALAEAMAANAAVMQGILDGFKVTEPPKVRVTRDSDMFKAEMERLGVPVGLMDDPRIQTASLLKMTDDGESYDPASLGFSFPPNR